LNYTDYLVDKYFSKDLMKLYGFTKLEPISNMLAALVQPKSLKTEIGKIKTDILLYRAERDKI